MREEKEVDMQSNKPLGALLQQGGVGGWRGVADGESVPLRIPCFFPCYQGKGNTIQFWHAGLNTRFGCRISRKQRRTAFVQKSTPK